MGCGRRVARFLSGGWGWVWMCTVLLLGVVPAAVGESDLIINEIHHSPDVKTEKVEFVELYNRSTNAVDLSGWRLSDGVEFVFAQGVVAGPGGYVVVAQDPVALKQKFGVTAYGPWTGRLDNHGETVELRDASGALRDKVTYKLGFPWPVVGDPPGYSIELINPVADNDLGGHWRASVAGNVQQSKRLVVNNGAVWRYMKGTAAPPVGWRETGFDDSGWAAGAAPIGYDPNVRMGTALDDMRGNYLSVFMRTTFDLTNAASITGLELTALYDDGFKLWINGTHITDVFMDSGEVPYDRPARTTRESDNFEQIIVNLPAGVLRDGRNVLAVHLANGNLSSSSDCFFDCKLSVVAGPSARGPTPGRLNAAFSAHVPPALRQVSHLPRQPRSGEPVKVTIKATSETGIVSVNLQYQIVDPGRYIELSDPAYASEWITLAMNDVGEDGDELAGDNVFTVTVPATVQQHRRLVRYRIVATDSAGASAQAPASDDPEPNFAFFCYDGVPAWTGAVRPGVTARFTVSAEEMNRLPVYHLIAKKKAVEDCTWYDRSHGDEYFWQGTLVYDGEVYDHIRFRPRGGVWRYAMGKNMWKFDFNRGHDFQGRDNWGRKFDVTWTKLNLGANIQQGDYLHRGEQGMFESVGFRLFQLAGVPAMDTAFVQFRIIDEQIETDPADQYHSDFWGLYLAVEQPDGRFLDAHGLPDGNLYKMEGGTGEPNNLGPDGPADGSDLRTFMNTYNSTPAEAWWRANLCLPSYYGYQAIVQAIHHYDIADGKNYFYYRNPADGLWWVIPWDLDLTWADNMYRAGQQGGDEPFKSRVLSNFSASPRYPSIVREFRNRVREIRDLLWNSDQAFALIDEYALLVKGTNNPSIIDADRAQWDYNPIMTNSSIVQLSKAGVGRFYQQGHGTKDFNGMVQLMKDYVGYRATNTTFSLDTIAAEPGIPGTPVATYSGPTGYPANGLSFSASPFSGTGFASVKWRIAEVRWPGIPGYEPSKPCLYEITPVWESAELGQESIQFTFPPGVAQAGHVYRVGVRYMDVTGRASHWSAPIQFVAGSPDNAALLVEHLQITELMFHPADDETYEFVELHNSSLTDTLDLGGVCFTEGIDYTFPAGTVMGPGAYLLVVRSDPANEFESFRAHYRLGVQVHIVGPYSGSLRNEGERITLRVCGSGETILSFAYDNSRFWPIAAQGAGHSMVPVPEALAVGGGRLLEYSGNWRASAYIGGSPGGPDLGPERSLLINEFMAAAEEGSGTGSGHLSDDWLELYNAGSEPLELAGWYLSDDPARLDKWQLAHVVLPAGSYLSVDRANGLLDSLVIPFALNGEGGELYLSHLPETGVGMVADAVRYKGQEPGYSYGRVRELSGCWARTLPTRDGPNVSAAVGLYISEVMYHPYDTVRGGSRLDNTADEYVEIYNSNPFPVSLAEGAHSWRLSGGVDFAFPAGVSIPANGYFLVVSFDPGIESDLSLFKRKYGIADSGVVVVGPYAGKLANSSDTVVLEKPVILETNGEVVAWAVVDEVNYADCWPWPEGLADGGGSSLQRVAVPGCGAAGWVALMPTPGMAWTAESRADNDLDGLPDYWEIDNELSPTDAEGENGGHGDPDGDGLDNRTEWMLGTRPRTVTLRFNGIESKENSMVIRHNVPAGFAVRVEASESLTGDWVEVVSWGAEPAPRFVEAIIPLWQTRTGWRFYRLVGGQ
ncbi:MAG: hypothetical protein GX456_10665 [Verrucomicrobia bacterium]|nr:hypothetical protein [Verrucomicrobiota bacterium]